MVDPLSIAGLTVAVLDDLIKVGNWTAQLIQDARAFDEDSQRFATLIESDASRSKLLKTLLFANATVYGGQTLFEQFNDDTQQQTIRLLEESKDILQSGLDLLRRRYGVEVNNRNEPWSISLSSSKDDLSTAPTLNAPNLTRSRSNTSIQALLMWSLRDKKRVESIIIKFNEQNVRVEESVKLMCLANTLGVNLAHLQHLREDASSRKLGFDIDATLILTQRDAESASTSLELQSADWEESLQRSEVIEHAKPFLILNKSGNTFLQENYDYVKPAWLVASPNRAEPCGLDTATMRRVEALARLLHQPKEQVFRVPPCIGWKYFPDKQTITFVFQVQIPEKVSPVGLLTLLSNRNNKDAPTPSLGDKFRLAAGLASCMAQLHMVGWLHESFRSENVLFLPSQALSSSSELDYASPWVLGFEFSRPDKGTTRANADFQPERDVYRHPERQGVPEVSFMRIHDIYALGVVLLEIGLWEPAIELQKNRFARVSNVDAELVRSQLLKHAEHRLEKRVGRRYKQLVVQCLKSDFGVVDDNREDLKLQQAFRAQVVDVLERAADAV